MKFPKHLALRLKGLSEGNFIANKNIKAQARYDFKTILFAFKICKSKIIKYLHDNETKIENENHKVNLIMKFAEQEINDVAIRLKQSKKAAQKVQNIDLKNQTHQGAKYQNKSVIVNEELEKLW